MELIVDNWYIILALLLAAAALVLLLVRFFRLPTGEQLEAVREWLLGAVTDAEKELGGGTGQLKLRSVYDRFVIRFPWVAKALSFGAFSDMVDDALVEMKWLLAQNEKIKHYVEGTDGA